MKIKTLLIIYAVLFFICFDAVTTLIAADHLGSFSYEKSNILKASYNMGGVYGFLAAKMVLGTALLLALYYLSEAFPKYDTHISFVLLGVALSGAYVGLSNLNIVVMGQSFWLFGIDAGTIAVIILWLPVCLYVIHKALRIPAYNEAKL